MALRIRNAIYRTVALALLAGLLASCDEGAAQSETSEPAASEGAGFEAVIAGAYGGEARGAGVLKLLPEAGFDKQGYFFLSDGQGIRPHGVTFVLPRGLAPGTYELASPSPLALGTVPSVRVDRDMGDAVLSSDRNTAGTLDLAAFPEDEASLSGSEVTGSFEFETEDPEGRKIAVTGSFSFTVD